MKKLILGVAAAAMTLTSGAAAFADPYDHGGWNRGEHHGWDRGEHHGWDRDDRDHDRHDWRRGGERWRAGGYYSGYRDRGRMVDWRAYHLQRPRDGYAYYREDNGDVVMAAIASGLIGMVLGNALSDQPSYGYSQTYGYSQPYGYGYQPYGGYQSYGYSYGYPY